MRFLTVALSLLWLAALPAAAQPSYLLFESGPVRPVALSPDGQQLFVANTPDGHLEIFDVGVGGTLSFAASVPVGLEPVAVAALDDTEVWVVNHLSDSVSIVDVASAPPRVARTLLVGDEPRDIVFAGSAPVRAFVSTAHRGQHRTHASISGVFSGPGEVADPQLTTEGIDRADVWVFDTSDPGSALGGVPDEVLTFFSDTPRALATDGTTVYVAAFHSGNQTTAIPELAVPDGFASSCNGNGTGAGVPGPSASDPDGPGGVPAATAPESGIILQFDGADWLDAQGCTWNPFVPFSLPDHDVFAVDAGTLAAASIPEFDHVGTILFNMAFNPTTQKLYVTNTESPNDVRFEGPGNEATGSFVGSTVQGHLSEARITVIDPSGPAVTPRHLNSHIDYGQLHTTTGVDHAAIEAQKQHSLATPLQMVVSGDQKIYVAAFGSSRVGVIDAAALEAGTFAPATASSAYIDTGGGPAGLAINASDDRLYVLTRFDQSVAVYDVGSGAKTLLQRVRLPSPEPASVVDGRPFLYDAQNTSGNGEASCASCHIFGDFDGLAWNLGNPDDEPTSNPQTQIGGGAGFDFHPMKGPMTTQTLRGMSTHGGLHWRGDRTNGFFGLDGCSGSSISNADCDEPLSFDNFLPAFEGLVGGHATVSVSTPGGTKDAVLSESDMTKFTDFTMQLMMPPNPVAAIDGSQTTEQANGESLYLTHPSDAGVIPCNTCHVLDPLQGFFGAGGDQSEEGEPQRFKVAHLRNMYAKVGMFGLVGVTGATGPQVRGFGFLHDGSVDTLFNFLEEGPFSLTPTQSAEIEQFMFAFPSDVAPVVGQQVSIGPGSPGSFADADVNARITTLDGRAGTDVDSDFDSFLLGGTVKECELVATTVESGARRGYLRQGVDSFLPDDGGSAISEAVLRAKADPVGAGQDVHYLCVAPGSGQRVGIDRDEDLRLNGEDNCPAWPNAPAQGTCTAGGAPGSIGSECAAHIDCGVGGYCSLAQEDSDGDGTGDACELALLPEPGRAPALGLGVALLAALGARRRR